MLHGETPRSRTNLGRGARGNAELMPTAVSNQQEVLGAYVPRLLIQWLGESPEASHRQVDGSIAFVDISGFTKLSERLARRGKVGAEELTEAIGGCFRRLLGVAYGNGGG